MRKTFHSSVEEPFVGDDWPDIGLEKPLPEDLGAGIWRFVCHYFVCGAFFMFVTTGVKYDLDALTAHASTVLHVPVFLAALLAVRGIPALLYRPVIPRERICVTARARLGFHAAWRLDAGTEGRTVQDRDRFRLQGHGGCWRLRILPGRHRAGWHLAFFCSGGLGPVFS